MKSFFTLITSLIFFAAYSQTPTYEEALKNEIHGNEIQNTEASKQKPYVIMVSLDGFRHDYAKKYGAKNILAIAENGSSANSMIPSFPSKTFPNHYTLATGLYPQNHGIVSNSFYDKAIEKGYKIGAKESVENGSWYGGVPLWNLAQLQGMVAASYFWVGSEADVNGLHPKYYYPYAKETPYEYRVKRIMEWLQMPEATRPHMITLYYSLVDTQGHRFGPEAEETKEAVLYVDEQIGALREGIAKSGLPVTLIVTSDHGMADITKLINIHDYLELEKDQFYSGPMAMIYTKNEAETNDFYDKLQNRENLKVYKKEAVPSYLNFNKSDRISDLVLITEPPYNIIYTEKEITDVKPGGTHGYDPFEFKDMHAILYIEGPKIKKNHVLSPIENIHIYPLVAHLLGLKIITPIDGKLEVTESVLIR
ncbi:MAG: ectonucleotide pyrophosphatase/phosphodiesterase [Spirosomaceae bacterium]|nr:ectonucleotide pyrophosphatase/phosphodiesterase [Spirosomataceae bacterium]